MAWSSAPIFTHAQGLGSDGGTTSAVDTSGADTIFLSVNIVDNAAPSISDSAGNTWTLVRSQDSSGFTVYNNLYRSATPCNTSASHTFTATATSGQVSICVVGFSGGATSGIDDQENGAGAIFTTTIQPGSITPGGDNRLVITSIMGAQDGVSIDSINGGFTVAVDHTQGAGGTPGLCNAIAYLLQTSAAAANPTWTFDGSTTFIATNIVDFVAAAGGGGGTVLPIFHHHYRNMKMARAPRGMNDNWMPRPSGLLVPRRAA